MKTILAVVAITYKEGLRNRILYGVMLFALLIMTFAVLISGLFMRDIGKITLDLCLAAVNIGGLLVPFFLAVNLLAKDIERRTVYSILSRAVSRPAYILGKYAGLLLLTGTIMAILTCAALLATWGGKAVYGAAYYQSFSIASVLLSVLTSFLGMMMLTACVVFWSTITTSSFLASLLTLFTYVIGQTVEDMVRFMSVTISGVEISPVVQHTVKATMYLFPNLAAFDIKGLAAHGQTLPASEFFFLFLYSTAYVSAVLCLAILIFRKRELV
jgi:ABC-type transport system involved in multi-copper enzyme maturation permease subunit